MIAQDEPINVGEHEAAICILRRADNWFAADVKTGVDDNRASSRLVESVHHRVKQPVSFGIDGLNAGAVVHMGYCWD